MTERIAEPNQNKSLRIAQFICSLPCWWLASKWLQAAYLPSNDPDIFKLYSYNKAIALAGIIICCMIYIKFFYQKLSNFISSKFSNIILGLSPILIFITLNLIVASTSYFHGVSVGEDISGQVKSAVQYQNGKTHAPNFLSKPNPHDLSKEIYLWSLRPPGASWLPLIGLNLGMTIGQSIWVSLLVFSLLGGVGWIKFSNSLGIGHEGQLILASFLGLYSGLQCNAFGTMNCVTFAIVPWMILWGKRLYSIYLSRSWHCRFYYLSFLHFYFCLGCFVLLKLSALIVAFTIGSLPFIFVLFNRANNLKEKAKLVSVIFLLSWFLIIPFKLLENINETLSGISANEMYSVVNYNEQSLLWGNHFNESTKGPLLLLSTLGGSGYSMSPKQIAHGARDFFLQFEDFRNWSNETLTNPHVLICGCFGLVFASLLLFLALYNRICFDRFSKIVFCIFFTLPFIGLSIISFKHGFNYTLYHAHTTEYVILLILPSIILWQNGAKFKRLIKFIFGICLAMPLTINAERIFFNFQYPTRTIQEKELGLATSRFSAAIPAIEKDSNNTLDILYFLPAGDMSDLILRTKLRTMATHFAGGNFPKIDNLKTTRKLNIYILYDSSLNKNSMFEESLISKFPQSVGRKKIYYGDVIAERIELSPSPNSNPST